MGVRPRDRRRDRRASASPRRAAGEPPAPARAAAATVSEPPVASWAGTPGRNPSGARTGRRGRTRRVKRQRLAKCDGRGRRSGLSRRRCRGRSVPTRPVFARTSSRGPGGRPGSKRRRGGAPISHTGSSTRALGHSGTRAPTVSHSSPRRSTRSKAVGSSRTEPTKFRTVRYFIGEGAPERAPAGRSGEHGERGGRDAEKDRGAGRSARPETPIADRPRRRWAALRGTCRRRGSATAGGDDGGGIRDHPPPASPAPCAVTSAGRAPGRRRCRRDRRRAGRAASPRPCRACRRCPSRAPRRGS